MKVSLAHHWMFSMRGGEKVLEQLKLLFPEAPISCLASDQRRLSEPLKNSRYSNSPLDRMKGARKFYKQLFPLHPWFIRRIQIDPDTSLLVSSDASMVKGISIPDGCKHICYCHSPPRYLWDLQEQYTQGNRLVEMVFNLCGNYLRKFDLEAAKKVDRFVANSGFVAERIQRIYGRDCDVVYPPVQLDEFNLCEEHDGYYLVVSQLTPYKKVELAVEACTQLQRPLVVIGQGAELNRLGQIAGPTVELKGSQPWQEVKRAYHRCKAFLFPQIEDFGITALEAQACGKPVIAYGQGGVTESVRNNETGLFFEEQSTSSLVDAIQRFEQGSHDISPLACRENAERFSALRFRSEMQKIIQDECPQSSEVMAADPLAAPQESETQTIC